MKHVLVAHYYTWGDYCCPQFGTFRQGAMKIIESTSRKPYVELHAGGNITRINHCPFCGAEITFETKGDHEQKNNRKKETNNSYEKFKFVVT